MRINVAFGQDGLELELPDGFEYRVLDAKWPQPLADHRGAIGQCLDSPIASPPLMDLARGKSSAAISVCDITRPAPNPIVLPPVLERLEAAGIPRERITILVATGLHRGATKEEIAKICGPSVAKSYRVLNHDARQSSEHRFLGATQSGTPVAIDRRFVDADLRITLGLIEPHLMLGFSGGRKLVAPGLAAMETIKAIHSPKFMRDALAVEGSVAGNPLHRELLEIARMAGHDFAVDAALARAEPGSARPIAAVFAGDPVEAHRRGMDFVTQAMLEPMDTPADAVITSAAGYPLDLTFYQAIKGVTAAAHIVKPRGRILLFAACGEGVGGREFSDLLSTGRSPGEFLEHIAHAPVTIDQWQLEKLALVTSRAEIHFYVPGLSVEYRREPWGAFHATPEAALKAVFSGIAPHAKVALIPEGPYVLAKLRGIEEAVQA